MASESAFGRPADGLRVQLTKQTARMTSWAQQKADMASTSELQLAQTSGCFELALGSALKYCRWSSVVVVVVFSFDLVERVFLIGQCYSFFLLTCTRARGLVAGRNLHRSSQGDDKWRRRREITEARQHSLCARTGRSVRNRAAEAAAQFQLKRFWSFGHLWAAKCQHSSLSSPRRRFLQAC